MTTPLVRTLAFCSLVALSPLAPAGTLFVDANLASGADDGSSWADAFQGDQGLQDALAAAVSGDQIFVAQGSYRPTDTGNRAVAFALENGVEIYGSFAGGEASPSERPPFGTADSVLTGDLNGDDGGGLFNDNSYHLITTTGTDASAVIDGFVVSDGAATVGGGNRDRGAGIICTSPVSPSVRNCRFLNHRATFGGAAGYVNNGGAPTFTDCSFEDGDGTNFGGAFDIAGGGPVRYERCLFRGNTADRGGALEIFSTNGVVVNNCVFIANTATGSGGGGAIWMGNGGNTAVRNSTIVSNDATGSNNVAGLRNQGAGGLTVSNTIFWDNAGASGGTNSINQMNGGNAVDHCIVQGGYTGGVAIVTTDPAFTDLAGGELTLSGASPAIDAGDNTQVPAGTTIDFAGLARFVDAAGVVDTGVGPAPVVDMGAHEFGDSAWTDLGFAMAGASGDPLLVMSGPLTGGSTVDVAVSNALGSASAWAIASVTLLAAPFKGGTLVPDAEIIVPLATTPGGTLALSFGWPLGIPAGISTWYQVWIQDAAGPKGFAATNGVQGTTP
jgi:hypothetical protein